MFKRLALKILNLCSTNKNFDSFVRVLESLFISINIFFHISLIAFSVRLFGDCSLLTFLFFFLGIFLSYIFSLRLLVPQWINRLYIFANYGDLDNLIKNFSIVPKDSDYEE